MPRERRGKRGRRKEGKEEEERERDASKIRGLQVVIARLTIVKCR